jgi:hypothetical protein
VLCCVDSVRAAALEFVLSLCETAPDMIRKHMPLISTLLELAAGFVCHVVDDPLWASKVCAWRGTLVTNAAPAGVSHMYFLTVSVDDWSWRWL